MFDLDQKEYLDKIKRYIEDEEMSFLIGAGFSRNINKDVYPMWGELLKDATWNLFGSGNRTKNEKRVVNKAVKDFGYLAIASMMVRKAGFHEAIDTYIEERTPFLKTKAGKPELFLNGTPLHETVHSDCHLLLKKLNIQNIYTFNYDNALEFFMGEEARLEAEEEILQLEKELTDLHRQSAQLAQKENDLNEQLKNIQNEVESSAKSPVINEKDDLRGRDEIQKDIDKTKEQRREIRQKSSDKYGRLEKLKLNRSTFYNVVKDSYEISLSDKRKSIYKIHGSLRGDDIKDYGFDGDTHKQYIITQEDYETYNEKHSAFVSMMRIDLLRSRFCIMGVSGGDANFLAWINWVKDVLDKKKARAKENDLEPNKSFFIYSSGEKMPSEMYLMLRNHFIQPVILKDIFTEATNDEERIKLFLEYIQPLKNETSRLSDLWGKIELRRNTKQKAKPIDKVIAAELFELSRNNRFNRPNSEANYMAVQVQSTGELYTGESADIASKMVYASALLCSLMPLDLRLDEAMEKHLRNEKDKELKDVFLSAIRRSGLLLNSDGLTKTLIGKDNYTKIVKGLFNFHFPTPDDIKEIQGNEGIDFVRKISLFNLIHHMEDVEGRCYYNDFKSPQELVLAADWLRCLDYDAPVLYKKADEYRQEEKKLLSFYEYRQAYLKAMRRKEEISSYGNISNTIYLDGFKSDTINAAILINSFLELGVCFAGNQVFDDSEWLEIVRALKSRYTAALVFYTIVRESNNKVIKTVAQELMYDRWARKMLPSILKNLISSLTSDRTPNYLKGKISLFSSSILCAVGGRYWQKLFLDSVKVIITTADKLRIGTDIPKQMYEFVANALNYIKDKEIKLWCLNHIFERDKIDEHFEGHLNSLAIAAREGLSIADFTPLVPKYRSFANEATKNNNQQGCFVVINLIGLIEKSHRIEYLKLLESRALKDAFLADGYAARIKSYPDLADSFKKKLLSGNDLWRSGIMESGISFGQGNVSISKIDRYLGFDEEQVMFTYHDLMKTVEKIEAVFSNKNHQNEDRGWLSAENNFREKVMDMRLFVHAHEAQLSKNEFFDVEETRLTTVYNRCFFGKSLYQLIADDKMYRAIRRLMVEVEIYGLEKYRLEYEQIIGKIIAKESSELGICFQHIVWIMSHRQSFFCTDDFKKLFTAILDVYKPYFDNSVEGALEWKLMGCQKEIAENSLITMYQNLKKWGESIPFWENYKRKFQVK